MVLEYLLYTVGFLGLFAGSYADLKTREVPDWISYGLIFSGLGIRMLFSLADFDWSVFIEGLVGFLVFVILAYLMYYFGQWGGGDAKLLMGLGAILGLGFDFSLMPERGVFLINLALAGTVYGMGWLAYLAIKNKKDFLKEFKSQQGQLKVLSVIFLIIVAVGIMGSFFFAGALRGLVLVLGIVPIGSLYVWLLVSSVEKISFYKKVRPDKLTEGDWIAKDIVVDGDKIAGPRDLGISEKQIARLVELKEKGKIKKVLIKEGIPFVPSFLIAFLATVIWGSWWMLLI